MGQNPNLSLYSYGPCGFSHEIKIILFNVCNSDNLPRIICDKHHGHLSFIYDMMEGKTNYLPQFSCIKIYVLIKLNISKFIAFYSLQLCTSQ